MERLLPAVDLATVARPNVRSTGRNGAAADGRDARFFASSDVAKAASEPLTTKRIPMSRPSLVKNRRAHRAAKTLLAAAMATALAACSTGEAGAPSATAPMPVPVSAPDRRTVPVVLELPGHVEAVERVELRPRVSGAIEQIAFAEGAHVRKGQLLVQIDPAPYAAALAGAEAELRQAEAQARLAATEAARAERLSGREAISTEEVERRAAQSAVALARRDAARAAVRRARLDLDYTRVLAPIDGRIGRAELTTGNLVGPSDRLAVLVADQRVYVRFDVAESALSGHASNPWHARFTLPESPDLVFEGTLAFLENEVSTGTGTVRARIALDGHAALVPGRYGQVQLVLGERKDALLVAETAIGADQGTRYVLVVDGEGTVLYRPVTAGARIGDQRVIERGLSPEDRVVVAGLMGVRPGMTVAPQDVSAKAAAIDGVALATPSEE